MGGPVWGIALPVAAWAASAALVPGAGRVGRAVRTGIQFLAGFCLIANGAYLGAGWVDRVGDAGDLMRHGTPAWALVAYGVVATTAGLLLWHLLGAKRGLTTNQSAMPSDGAPGPADAARSDST